MKFWEHDPSFIIEGVISRWGRVEVESAFLSLNWDASPAHPLHLRVYFRAWFFKVERVAWHHQELMSNEDSQPQLGIRICISTRA